MKYKIGQTVKIKKLDELKKIILDKFPDLVFVHLSIHDCAGQKFKIKKTEHVGCYNAVGYVLDDSYGTYCIDDFIENLKEKLDKLL